MLKQQVCCFPYALGVEDRSCLGYGSVCLPLNDFLQQEVSLQEQSLLPKLIAASLSTAQCCSHQLQQPSPGSLLSYDAPAASFGI